MITIEAGLKTMHTKWADLNDKLKYSAGYFAKWILCVLHAYIYNFNLQT